MVQAQDFCGTVVPWERNKHDPFTVLPNPHTLLNKILFCKPEKGYLTNSTGLALSKPKPVDSLNDDIWYDKFFSAKIKKIKNKTSLPVALYKARYLKFFL